MVASDKIRFVRNYYNKYIFMLSGGFLQNQNTKLYGVKQGPMGFGTYSYEKKTKFKTRICIIGNTHLYNIRLMHVGVEIKD